MNRFDGAVPHMKDFFWSFHQLKDYFSDYGNLYLLKCNEFYDADKFEVFQTSIQILTQYDYIEPASQDQAHIYLYQMNELRPQFQISCIYSLTEKGKKLIKLLPSREDIENTP